MPRNLNTRNNVTGKSAVSMVGGPLNIGMRTITTFRSTKDRIYDGGPIIL